LESIAALYSLCVKPMQSVPLKRCKAFRSEVAESVLVGGAANVGPSFSSPLELV
jgi:hypothetical protein